MCNPTNLDKNNMAPAVNGNSLRRIHRRSPTTVIASTGLCVSTDEEATQRTMLAESNAFTATLSIVSQAPKRDDVPAKDLADLDRTPEGGSVTRNATSLPSSSSSTKWPDDRTSLGGSGTRNGMHSPSSRRSKMRSEISML